MPAPTVEQVTEYLDDPSWGEDQVTAALSAEKAAQAARCRVPADDQAWPADLVEALYRRVAHNLAVRGLPLGFQSSMSEVAVSNIRVGGTDAEVRRLEGPYRRLVVG